MLGNSNSISLFKKQCYISYLIFFIFLNKKSWIFFLLNIFYEFFFKFLLIYRNNKKKFKKINIFTKLKKDSTIINYKTINKLNNLVLYICKYSYSYMYNVLKKIFYFFKTFLTNIYTSFFFNTFDKISIIKKKFVFKKNSYYKWINSNSDLSVSSKIYFYYLYKKNNKLFLNNFYYFDNSIYKCNNTLNQYSNKYYLFINSLIHSKSPIKNNISYNLNNSFYINKYFLKKNFFKNINNMFLFKKILFKQNFFYLFFFNNYSLNTLLYYKTIRKTYNKFFFFIINYNLKDSLNYNFYKKVFYTGFFLFIKKNNFLINKKKPETKTNYLMNQNIINFFIYKKIYYLIKKKNIFNNIKWYSICNFYYNKIIILKYIISLLYFSSSKKFYNNYFKYFLLYSELNFLNIVKSDEVLSKVINNPDYSYPKYYSFKHEKDVNRQVFYGTPSYGLENRYDRTFLTCGKYFRYRNKFV